jgi:phosphoglycolate phosphatase-like HAD superfamily hydrolase
LPTLLEQAARELGSEVGDGFVIGDKPCDIEMGRAAGATTLLVRTGYGAAHEASGAAMPDYFADDLLQAAAVVRRWFAGSKD